MRYLIIRLLFSYIPLSFIRYLQDMTNNSLLKDYSYTWVTLGLFVFSLFGHWATAWVIYKSDQQAHNQPVEVSQYITQTARDTLENWQSEFLQLVWQVGGLAVLWHLGSPQSKEGDDRKEEKIDEILRAVNGKKADKFIAAVDKKYPRK
ncbi:MAG TPA: DUF6766 family protein [Patescibacteria group bacterium]